MTQFIKIQCLKCTRTAAYLDNFISKIMIPRRSLLCIRCGKKARQQEELVSLNKRKTKRQYLRKIAAKEMYEKQLAAIKLKLDEE